MYPLTFLHTCKPSASVMSCGKEFPCLNTLCEEIPAFVHLKLATCKFHFLFPLLVLVAAGRNHFLFTSSMPVMILEILTSCPLKLPVFQAWRLLNHYVIHSVEAVPRPWLWFLLFFYPFYILQDWETKTAVFDLWTNHGLFCWEIV